jgi:SET family sugar efflux transporter-like MFS transporter
MHPCLNLQLLFPQVPLMRMPLRPRHDFGRQVCMIKEYLNKRFFSFLTLIFCSGSSLAMTLPIMSLYLMNEVHADGSQLGNFFIISAVSGIIVTQIIAKFSDSKLSRRDLMILGYSAGALTTLTYIFFPDYGIIVTAGVAFSSISMVATPQVFALAREYALLKYGDALMFTSYLRAVFSLSWVMTPPIAYVLFVDYGSRFTFMVATMIFLTGALVAFFMMPKALFKSGSEHDFEDTPSSSIGDLMDSENSNETGRNSQSEAHAEDVKGDSSRGFKNLLKSGNVMSIVFLFLAFMLLWCCNSAYLISMPVFVTREASVAGTLIDTNRLPGVMMGLAALLEIPVMIYCGGLARKIGLKTLIILCGCFGCLFYVSLSFGPISSVSLLFMQIFNAIFIGILASLGMVYMQELLPKFPGQATTLYNNSVHTGGIISGYLVSRAMSAGGTVLVFETGIVFTAIAVVLLFAVSGVGISRKD